MYNMWQQGVISEEDYRNAAAQPLTDRRYIDLICRTHGDPEFSGFFFFHGNADLCTLYL